MKNKGKLKTIADAFLKGDKGLPREEEWFQQRIEACGACEFNSKNTEDKYLKVEDKVKIATGVCTDKEHCTLCGCCIYQKASEKGENCALLNYKIKALAKKGLNNTPDNINKKEFNVKWKAIGVETTGGDLNLHSTSKEVDTVYLDEQGTAFTVLLKDTSASLIDFNLVVSKKDSLKISSVKASCSCTVPKQEQKDDKTVDLRVKISTNGFSKNSKFTKAIFINYYVNERSVKKIKVNLIGKKI